ncbi:MAG: hypothetical protein R3B47_18160 [Bacteroidia bacterium]
MRRLPTFPLCLGDAAPDYSPNGQAERFSRQPQSLHYRFSTMPVAAGERVNIDNPELPYNGELVSSTTPFYLKPTFAMTGLTPTQPYWLTAEPGKGVSGG